METRPDVVRAKIDDVFNFLTERDNFAHYIFAGEGLCAYNFFGSDLIGIIENIIDRADREERETYLMDVGAGCGGWSKFVSKHIEKNKPTGSTVHIYNLNAENITKILKEETIGRVTIHNINQCKVEELADNPELQGKTFDLIVSQKCLMHLVDPVGTLPQIYNCLRVGGLFFGDQFIALGENEEHIPVHDALRVFYGMNVPFIFNFVPEDLDFQFAIKRKTSDQCILDIRYANKLESDESDNIAAFNPLPELSKEVAASRINSKIYFFKGELLKEITTIDNKIGMR